MPFGCLIPIGLYCDIGDSYFYGSAWALLTPTPRSTERHGFGLGFMMDGDRIVFMDGTYDGELSASLRFDQWTHVAGTHGPTGSALYIDGEVVAQRPGQTETRYHPSADFLIGRTPGTLHCNQ